MSVSQEHLYRLIRAGAFPALRMRLGQKGRYVVPARAVEALLDAATDANTLIDVEASTSTSFFEWCAVIGPRQGRFLRQTAIIGAALV
jgi:hypothetical protein